MIIPNNESRPTKLWWRVKILLPQIIIPCENKQSLNDKILLTYLICCWLANIICISLSFPSFVRIDPWRSSWSGDTLTSCHLILYTKSNEITPFWPESYLFLSTQHSTEVPHCDIYYSFKTLKIAINKFTYCWSYGFVWPVIPSHELQYN